MFGEFGGGPLNDRNLEQLDLPEMLIYDLKDLVLNSEIILIAF